MEHAHELTPEPFISHFPKYLLLIVVTCQAISIALSWPLWQIRIDPPNLPLLPSLRCFAMSWPMLLSLAFVIARPKHGIGVHAGTLVLAIAFDQFRAQPQFIGLAILLFACVGSVGRRIVRWYLTSTWLWAGIHKLVSPDWLGPTSWSLIEELSIRPDTFYLPFAIIVGITEVSLGVLSIFRPRLAAPLCVALHIGIVLFMSPIGVGKNESVIPWNIAMAIGGFYCLRNASTPFSTSKGESAIACLLLVLPMGFYFGWVDRSCAAVLYSDSLPKGLITTTTGTRRINAPDTLAVPFPQNARALRQYFELTANPGEKLHIADPRRMVDDHFYLLSRSRTAQPIDVDQFFAAQNGQVAGVGLDLQRAIFALSRGGATMLRESAGDMVYAVKFSPGHVDPELLDWLIELPNVRQVQLADTDISDADLKTLSQLRLLTGLGIDHTSITDEGLIPLLSLPYLTYVECEGTSVSNQTREFLSDRSSLIQ